MNKISIVFTLLFLSGCAQVGHKEFYKQVAPKKYSQTSNVMVFEYNNVELDKVYNLLFSELLLIGRSSFNGPYENPELATNYAKSIGSDVFISTTQFKETRTSFMNLTTPTTSTTYISGYNGSGSVYGTATTYSTQTTTIPIQVDRYDQEGFYLKNINNVDVLWNRTSTQYKETEMNPLSGIWENESYSLNIFQSGEQMVTFIDSIIAGDSSWSKGQIKMIFGTESTKGIYLMGDKTPMPANFSINKFGHLEITLLLSSEKISFAKKS